MSECATSAVVVVSIGPVSDRLRISSECSDGISWVALGLPEWSLRYRYAPPSNFVPGDVLLSAVRDSGEVVMTVSVEGSSLADVELKKSQVEAALLAWPGRFKAEATYDGETVIIAGPWDSFPTLPRWGDVLPTVLGYYLVETTVSIPVNPVGAP